MAKDKITDYDPVAGNNEDVGGVNIAENCDFGNMNNMGREIMSHLAETNAGTNPVADTWSFADPADLTKIWRVDCGSISTSSTRVWTPPDEDMNWSGISSQAAGDLIYRGASNWANLAKGTSRQVLRMNDGATAPEWVSGGVAQVVHESTSTATTGTTVIPVDNTLPVITEGDEYETATITPKDTANRLVIECHAWAAVSTNTTYISGALFQDSTTNSLSAGMVFAASNNIVQPLYFRHEMAAGTTSATTFRLRLGPSVAGTLTLNGSNGSGLFAGRLYTSITITEYWT